MAGLYPNTREVAVETKQRAWREYGMLVVNVEQDVLTWDERELLKRIGQKLFGPRRCQR